MEVVFKVTENWAFKNVFQGEETQSKPTQFLLLDMYKDKRTFYLTKSDVRVSIYILDKLYPCIVWCLLNGQQLYGWSYMAK